MNAWMRNAVAISAALLSTANFAQELQLTKPHLILNNVVPGMPIGQKQEVRVLTATFAPGTKTVSHTHRFPVTVFIVGGTFTLEQEGRAPVKIGPGEAYVEPPHIKMTGYNRSVNEPLNVVIFYVSEPDTPFLDPIAESSAR